MENYEKEIYEVINNFDATLTPKAKQIECLNHALSGKDVIANLPVGYGKSLVYQVFPSLVARVKDVERPVALVIAPLNIIQMEQIDELNSKGIKACKLTYQCGEEESDIVETETIEDIIQGEYSVVFAHPEALLNTTTGSTLLRSRDFTKHVTLIAIDECHIVEEWGKEFRTAYQRLNSLPAVFEETPVLALSGTLTTNQLKTLPSILGLNNPVIVQESPDRENIYLEKISKIKSRDAVEIYEDIFVKECDKLYEDPTSYPVTLMFMPLFYISQAAAYLRHLFGPGDITKSCYAVLYSRQDKVVLKTTIENLHTKQPRIRLILTSSVAGMGFDPPCIQRVIHTRPPRSLSQYLQEIGRAGRRGQASTAILYHNKKDVAKNLPGIQEDILEYCSNEGQCLRQMLLAPFGFSKNVNIPEGKCCSFCSSHGTDVNP